MSTLPALLSSKKEEAPKSCAVKLRWILIDQWLHGYSCDEISKRLRGRVSVPTVQKYVRCFKKTGDVITEYEIYHKYTDIIFNICACNVSIFIVHRHECMNFLLYALCRSMEKVYIQIR